MQRRNFLTLCSGLALSPLAKAQLTIEVTGSAAQQIPIAIPAFEGDTVLPKAVAEIVRDDLTRCGLFRLVEAGTAPTSEATPPDWAAWRDRGADALLVGSVSRQPDGRFQLRFRLSDVSRQLQLEGQSVTFTTSQHRMAAHRVADAVLEKLIGIGGMFASLITYVSKTGGQYSLVVADSDSANPVRALISSEPIISPAWSPDGQRIAYVAFDQKKPIVHIRELATTRRPVLANFKGSNSSPTWSPDGSRLAVVLTKDGISQIYVINADGSGSRRLMSSSSIDTEPTFSPDGRTIYFTSDRGGSPQIYRVGAEGGEAQRVTYDGSYNVSARVSPDGKTLAYITRSGGRFQVAAMDLATQQSQVLTDSARDESPSFSPNGRFVLYATEQSGRGVLSVVSIDGKTKFTLTQQSSDVREPAWGPLVR